MLKIRLSRIGKRNAPQFRIVVAEHTAPVKGKFIESLGFFNPKDKTFKVDEERLKLWLSRGAKPSPTVHNKLVNLGIIKGPKLKASKKKRKKKKEEKVSKEETKEKVVEAKEETKEKVVEAKEETKEKQKPKEKKEVEVKKKE